MRKIIFFVAFAALSSMSNSQSLGYQNLSLMFSRNDGNGSARFVAMGGALIILLLIPFTNTSEVRSTTFRPIFKIFYWLLVADFLILGWIGQKPVKDVYVIVGQVATVFYFLFFLVLIPAIGIIESKLTHQKKKLNFSDLELIFKDLKLLFEKKRICYKLEIFRKTRFE